MHSLYFRRFLAVMVVSSAMPATSAAQMSNTMRDVTLIQLPTAPHGKQAMVYRRASGTDRDVIALAPAATAADLTSALLVLEALDARVGAAPQHDVAAAVRTAPVSRAGDARTRLHGSFMEKLDRSSRTRVVGFGSVKTHRITVPKRTTSTR